jgi:ethanolamine utilization protein EutN
MQLARVVGHATATVKHPSMTGWRLLVVQPTGLDGDADGDPLLVVDSLGAARRETVLITNDGAGARQLIGDNTTPVRWTVMGIPDRDAEKR